MSDSGTPSLLAMIPKMCDTKVRVSNLSESERDLKKLRRSLKVVAIEDGPSEITSSKHLAEVASKIESTVHRSLGNRLHVRLMIYLLILGLNHFQQIQANIESPASH